MEPAWEGQALWPELPIEFNVIGTPVSHQSANAAARQKWKDCVRDAAVAAVGGDAWAFEDYRLAVTLFYFPQSAMSGDLDNIVKLTLDALKPKIYLDDNVIDRVVAQRFDPTITVSFAVLSTALSEALVLDEPVLFVRISDVPLERVQP